MNLSSLSSQLNLSIQELRDKSRIAGFVISPRANKIDNYTAKQIMEALGTKVKPIVDENKVPEVIQLPAFIKVREFAELLKLPVTTVIKALIKNGVMATINE